MDIRILGPLETSLGDRLLTLPHGRGRALFVALLVHHNQVVSSTRLIEWLWDDGGAPGDAAALQTQVWRLRVALRDVPPSEAALMTRQSGYELHARPESIDAVRFERLVSSARGLRPSDPSAACAGLREALSLWRGRALEGFEHRPFAAAKRVHLEEMRLGAIEDLVEAEMGLGRHTAVIADLQSALADHPTRERLTELLMRALYRSGRQAEALDSYRKLRRCLVDELGIEPSPDLQRLERAILRQDPVPDPASPPERAMPTIPSEVIADAGADRAPFIGREGELAELCALMESAATGHGAVVMLGGEPGVGKTRLAEEAHARACAMGFRAFTGHCYEGGGDLPYMPWVEMIEALARQLTIPQLRAALGDEAPEFARLVPQLRRLLPDMPKALELPPDQQRRYTFHSIRDYVTRASRQQPRFYVLEDLHWADESTLLLLEHLAEALPTIPCLIVATYRDPPVDVSPRLAAALSELVRRRLARLMTLRRHSEAEVEAMLHALAGQKPPESVTATVYGETEGNAFFVEELFHHLSANGRLLNQHGRFRSGITIEELDVPQNVRLVTGHRLNRLDEATGRLMVLAAVAGRRFSFELLEALGELDGEMLLDALEEAERARLITGEATSVGTLYWFSHELIRQTLLSRLSPPRRQRLHLRIADALERVHARDLALHAADLAHHLVQAGPAAGPQRTAHFLVLAGQRALGAAAFDEALRYLQQALELLPPTDERERAHLLLRIGHAQRSLGRWDDTLETWERTLTALEAVGEGEAEVVGSLCYEFALQLCWSVRFSEALVVVHRGLAVVGDHPGPERAHLVAISCIALSQAGRFDEAASAAAEAQRLAAATDDVRLHANVDWVTTYHHYTCMRLVEARTSGERGAARMRAAGTSWDLAHMLALLDVACTFQGDFHRSDEVNAELEPLIERLGHWGAAALARRNRFPKLAAEHGDLASLDAFARDQLDAAGDLTRHWIGHATTMRGVVELWRGRWAEARAHMEEGARLALPGMWHGVQHGFLLLLLALQGAHEEAHALYASLSAALPATGRSHMIGQWNLAVLAAESMSVLGDAERASALHPLVVEALATGTAMRQYDGGLLQTAAGMAAATARLWDAAEGHFETALRMADELPHVIERPHVRDVYGRFLVARGGAGDHARARGLLAEAVAVYRSTGMPRHEAGARQLLDALATTGDATATM